MPLLKVKDPSIAKFEGMGGVIDEVNLRSDRGDLYGVDHQYLLMGRWAFDRLRDFPVVHDFGGDIGFLTYLSAFCKVKHYDIRKPDIGMPGLEYWRGDLVSLPLSSGSVAAASCLHVAEHIGLGRYGDAIDPEGFNKACAELKRVLSVGGSLFFAVPTGKPRVVFNSHRVLSTDQVLKAFKGLRLIEHSAVDSRGYLTQNVTPGFLDNDPYGCGLFHFVKEN